MPLLWNIHFSLNESFVLWQNNNIAKNHRKCYRVVRIDRDFFFRKRTTLLADLGNDCCRVRRHVYLDSRCYRDVKNRLSVGFATFNVTRRNDCVRVK